MKSHLPLTLAMVLTMAGGTVAQPGSQFFPQGRNPHTVSTAPQVAETTTPGVSSTAADVPAAAPSTATAPGGSTLSTTQEGAPALTPAAPVTPETPLEISPVEREYFDFGYSLAKAAFSYADIAKQSLAIQQSKDRTTQIKLLAALAPAADRDRADVRASLDRAESLMLALHASPSALAVIQSAIEGIRRPLILTGAAKDLSDVRPDAGRTLASLNEFERISGLTESPEIALWLKGRHKNRTGNVWYAEGLIAGVAEVASAQNMPELLPTVGEVATDLRGLRDWLLLRMPDPPSPQQAALNVELDQFLRSTSTAAPDLHVSHAQLASLGTISRELEAEVLPQTASDAPVSAAPQVAVDVKKGN